MRAYFEAIAKQRNSSPLSAHRSQNSGSRNCAYSAALDAALHEYAEVKSQAAGLDPVELYEARQAIRLGQEAAANEKLEQVFGSKYSLLRWMDAKQAQIRLTNDSLEEYAARQQAKQKYKSISQPVRKRNHEQER